MPATEPSAHRRSGNLFLSAAAALVLVTLTWAGLRLHRVTAEKTALEVSLSESRRTLRSLEAKQPPLLEAARRADGLASEVSRLEARQRDAPPVAVPEVSARETELQELIAFLRREIDAARLMIVQLEKDKTDMEAKAAAAKPSGRQRNR